MNITELVKAAHDNAVEHGFYECPKCGGSGKIIIHGDTYMGEPDIMEESKCPKCKGAVKQLDKNVGELLMLVVSELGEALEAHRKGRLSTCVILNVKELHDIEEFKLQFERRIKDSLQDELADAVIRIADMCGYLGIDLEKHIELKMKYNATREYKHGKRY